MTLTTPEASVCFQPHNSHVHEGFTVLEFLCGSRQDPYL